MEQFKQIADLNLVAFLVTAGFKYKHPPKISVRFTIFEFPVSEELEQSCRDYFGRMAKVDALTLSENIRTIKAMVRELRGDRNV